jgi:hypothetical protein
MGCKFTLRDWRRETGQRLFSLKHWKTLSGLKRFTLPSWCDFVEAPAPEAPYHADAVNFAANTFLSRAALLTGVADSPLGLVSVWTNGGQFGYVGSGNNGLVSLESTGSAKFYFQDIDATSFVEGNNAGPGAGWQHTLIAWNMNFGIGNRIYQIYRNDAVVAPTVGSESGVAFSLPYTQEAVWELLRAGSAGGAADAYFAFGQYLDISVEANRRKFISAELKPVFLGADGSTPTGLAPACFFSGNAASFATNLGPAGAFSVSGTPLTNASTSPSD